MEEGEERNRQGDRGRDGENERERGVVRLWAIGDFNGTERSECLLNSYIITAGCSQMAACEWERRLYIWRIYMKSNLAI